MRAGVLEVESVFLIDAADQQHEVHRSGDVEDLAARPNRMEEQSNSVKKPFVSGRWPPTVCG